MSKEFTGNDVYEARCELSKEQAEQRKAAAKAVLVAFGDDTYDVGDVLRYVVRADGRGTKDTPVVIMKQEKGWVTASSSYSSTWSDTVDNLVSAGITPADVVKIYPAATVADETPAA